MPSIGALRCLHLFDVLNRWGIVFVIHLQM